MDKYGLYNVVWYNGETAGVSKFILINNDEQAKKDVEKYVTDYGFSCAVLLVDFVYGMPFDTIISYKDRNGDEKQTYKRFIDMYF